MQRTSTSVRRRMHPALAVLLCGFLFLSFLAIYSASWYRSVYGDVGFDSILWTLSAGVEGTSGDLIEGFLLGGPLPALGCTIAAAAILALLSKTRIPPALTGSLGLVLGLGLLIWAACLVRLPAYIFDQLYPTSLYEDHYVDPAQAGIQAPEEKRNLVYIMLESMETTYFDAANGGAMDRNLIPELTRLAENNLNFSHTSGVGGFHQTSGASWTIAAMVAHTAGIPLKTPSGNQNDYGQGGEEFLPGITTITDILHDAGYYTALMVGSDANFGGRKPYFTQHGIDRVYDIYTARRDGIVPGDYFVWWGMEDLHLFEYAKQELTKISQQDQPFAFTMLTVDTHHIGGYQCIYCDGMSEETYEQSISCSDRQVLEFVQWLKAQPFYENTTVVITGDHESMDRGYFDRNVDDRYERMVYHCILNAPLEPVREKRREYCAVDLFPTTLAALGFEIPGDRLGLGTNLFSSTPTLAESWGFERFNAELSKASEYYVEHFHSAN